MNSLLEEVTSDSDFKVLCQRLSEYGVTKIISYDDEWEDIGKEKTHIKREDWLEKDLFEFKELFIEEDEFSVEQFNSIREIIDFELESSKIKYILESDLSELGLLKEILNKKFNSETTIDMLKKLKELLEIVEKTTGIKWEFKSRSFFNTDINSSDERILFIIDKDMSRNQGPSDSIKQVIPDINTARPDHMDLMLVYTNDNISSLLKHEDKIKYFLNEMENINPSITEEDAHLLAYQLWPFNKTNDKNQLIKDLKKILEDASFGHSLHDYLSYKLNYRKQMNLEILKISEDAFKYLYRDTFIEGCLFTDTLQELERCIYNRVNYESIKKNDKYKQIIGIINFQANEVNNQILNDINSIEDKENNIKKYREKLVVDKYSGKLHENLSEYGIVDYSINSNLLDISCGDIFILRIKETGELKYGILINQECDLVVRFQGTGSRKIGRVAKKADLLLCDFFAIKETTKFEDLEDKLWPIKCKRDKIALDVSDKNRILSLDIKLLDLCTLNDKGQAKLNVIEDNLHLKTYHFQQYFKSIIKPWISNLENIEYLEHSYNVLYENLSQHFKGKNNHVKKEFLKFIKELEYKIEFNKNQNEFKIERVGRLERNKLLSIIQSKYHNMSRIGVPATPLIS